MKSVDEQSSVPMDSADDDHAMHKHFYSFLFCLVSPSFSDFVQVVELNPNSVGARQNVADGSGRRCRRAL